MPTDRPLFLVEPGTDRIRFTPYGMERLRARFAAAGIDIRQVRTRTAALAVLEASSHVVVEQLRALAGGDEALTQALRPLLDQEHG